MSDLPAIEMTIVWRNGQDPTWFPVTRATYEQIAQRWINQTDGDAITFPTCALPNLPARTIMLRMQDILCIC